MHTMYKVQLSSYGYVNMTIYTMDSITFPTLKMFWSHFKLPLDASLEAPASSFLSHLKLVWHNMIDLLFYC